MEERAKDGTVPIPNGGLTLAFDGGNSCFQWPKTRTVFPFSKPSRRSVQNPARVISHGMGSVGAGFGFEFGAGDELVF